MDELPVLLLDAAITFINACPIEQLKSVPNNRLEPLLAYVKKLWRTTRKQILHRNIVESNELVHLYPSNFTTENLAESIFRLSIYTDEIKTSMPPDNIKTSIFGLDQSSFEDFILNTWEESPLLMRGSLKASYCQNSVFDLFRQCLNFNDREPSSFSSTLKNLISCPPISSDALDILTILHEARGQLGFPMIYKQDLRVLKTQDSSGELHFFKDPKFLYISDILKCEEAYKEGHTIAIRGMGFRFENIAAVVDGLAYLFGQPSAGANLYLTPPNSQGLARHYDDHCVIVCQLSGVKKWGVYPRSTLLLPRLYEPVDSLLKVDGLSGECNQFVLREGDVLYIPRGFFHEACTVLENEEPDEVAGHSLHLTLAIEVEPPFEWEGFAHMALHNWFQNEIRYFKSPNGSMYHSLYVISMNLMHMAIKIIGDNDPIFRKACLVGAISVLSDDRDRILQNQKAIFSHMIKIIDAKSSFSDALGIVTASLRRNEDPFRQLRWLNHISDDNGDIFEPLNWETAQVQSEQNFIFICNEHKEAVKTSFKHVKSKFCYEVEFGEVESGYNMLLEKYRTVRKQYMKGMVSLHCN